MVRPLLETDAYRANAARGMRNAQCEGLTARLQILRRHHIGSPKTNVVQDKADVLPAKAVSMITLFLQR